MAMVICFDYFELNTQLLSFFRSPAGDNSFSALCFLSFQKTVLPFSFLIFCFVCYTHVMLIIVV